MQQHRQEQSGAWTRFAIGTLAIGATMVAGPAGMLMGGSLGIVMQDPTISSVAASAAKTFVMGTLTDAACKSMTKQ